MNKTRNLLAVLGIGAAALGVGSMATKDINFYFDSKEKVVADGKTLEVPRYSLRNLPPGQCAKYVRKAAHEVFGLDYSWSNGWDRKYNDRLIARVNNNEDLERMERKGRLKPGMIVSSFYPGSPHLGRKDQHGRRVNYTHNLLYLGKNEDGKMLFVSQIRTRTRIMTLEDLSRRGIGARDVVVPKGSKKSDFAN